MDAAYACQTVNPPSHAAWRRRIAFRVPSRVGLPDYSPLIPFPALRSESPKNNSGWIPNGARFNGKPVGTSCLRYTPSKTKLSQSEIAVSQFSSPTPRAQADSAVTSRDLRVRAE